MATTTGLDPRKKQIESMNKLGIYTIPIIAIVAWATGMSYFGDIEGGWHGVEWGDFALHPTFMVTGFLLFGSLTVISYRICRIFGFSHDIALWIYMLLNSIALGFIWMGWEIIWWRHNSSTHYNGSHSRVGIFAIILWCIYYVTAFYIFFLAAKEKVVSYMEVHQAFGMICIILGLWTIGLGLLWEEYSFDADRDVYARSRSGVVVGGVLMLIFLIFGLMMYARMLLPK